MAEGLDEYIQIKDCTYVTSTTMLLFHVVTTENDKLVPFVHK